MNQSAKPWLNPMGKDQFQRMCDILAAPSPIGLEGAMTQGVLKPMLQEVIPSSWKLHTYRGNAGMMVDTAPGNDDAFSVMVIGHADKIRMQVRSIGDDGKIWINSESFLPITLIGHETQLFSEDPENPGSYRIIEGGTVEAIGAIHFAEPPMRDGSKGLKPTQLFLELQLHGKERKKQVEDLGIRPGDSIILKRTIRRGFAPDTFYGAYLDNGLGCFVVEEVARLISAEGPLKNIRYLGAFAAYEEIGRFGSRVLAQEHRPDVIIGVDVNHDLDAAPGVSDKHFDPLKMAEGMTLTVGSIANAGVNAIVQNACRTHGIPVQMSVCGRDTGTDAMAAVLSGIDSAATSVGFPIRNMHTISETGHTGDVLTAIHGIYQTLRAFDGMNEGAGIIADDLRSAHPRLDKAKSLAHGG
ncbi:MAG TPA: peptidase M42 [Planctomycetes bacterium]|nr:peptidase M42 [Planctomycetota bacterium]HIN79775.1 peptidase M42 [Planctomycetota bacterium]